MAHWYQPPEHMRAIAHLGGIAAGATKRSWPAWKRMLLPTRAALKRWDPDNAILSIPRADYERAFKTLFEMGYRAGLGRKRWYASKTDSCALESGAGFQMRRARIAPSTNSGRSGRASRFMAAPAIAPFVKALRPVRRYAA